MRFTQQPMGIRAKLAFSSPYLIRGFTLRPLEKYQYYIRGMAFSMSGKRIRVWPTRSRATVELSSLDDEFTSVH